MTDNLIIKKESLTAIADAIRKKTGKTDMMTVSQMKDEIESIEAGGGAVKFKDLRYFYYYGARIDELPPQMLDTSECTNMYDMFYQCTITEAPDLSGFNTSKVTNMESMFQACHKLLELDVSNFNTCNVKNMNNMFAFCRSLNTLDLSGFNTSNVTIMRSMFSSCSSLKTLDLSNFDTNKVTSMYAFIGKCTNLKDIYIKDSELNSDGKLKFKLPESGVFDQVRTNGGKIHLSKTLEDNYKSATNWSAYTDIMVFDQP